MNLQGAPTFSPEDYPDVPEALLQRLTEAFDELYAGCSQLTETAQLAGRTFVTDELGSGYCDLKNPLSANPSSVVVDQLRPLDVSTVTGVWSFTWLMAGETVRLLFVGLAVSTKYVLAVSLK